MKQFTSGYSSGITTKGPIYIFICFILFVIFISIFAGCISDDNPRLFAQSYTFDIVIHSSVPITNVTFILPLPVKNGQPMVGTRTLQESNFRKNNMTATIVCSQEGLNLTEAYPVSDNSPCFVKLMTDVLLPGRIPDSGYTIQISDFRDVPSPFLFSNTLSPVGNESVFLPKFDFAPIEPTVIGDTAVQLRKYREAEITYKAILYADYSASAPGKIEIGSHIRGLNEWVEASDAWMSNSYGDYYSWSHTGESHGWQKVSGTLYAGVGTYPNLTHPIWQKAIQKAQLRT